MQKIREHLEKQLREFEERLEKIDRDRRRENNALEEDWEEQATVRQNDEVLDGLEAEGREQVSAIREAIKRIDEGSYGVCTDCGDMIALARLEALPQATLCIQCAEAHEHS